MRHRFQVGSDAFFILDAATTAAVKSEIGKAIREGGAFVRFGVEGAPEVLITASTFIRIDTLDDLVFSSDAAQGSSTIDYDYETQILLDR